jgi:hypothetical protein
MQRLDCLEGLGQLAIARHALDLQRRGIDQGVDRCPGLLGGEGQMDARRLGR